MQLLLVRHAIAEDRHDFARDGRDDDLRPLTERGTERMRLAVVGLGRVLPGLDLIASSPLTRAAQSADLLAEAFPRAARETLPALSPGGERASLPSWLAERDRERVALVGHEPDLSELAAWLLSGRPSPFMEFKKGSVCLLGFDAQPQPGSALLHWHLAPRQMRALAAAVS